MKLPGIIALLICLTLAGLADAAPRCAPSISVLLSLDRLGEVEHETLVRPAADGSGDVQWIIWLNEVTGSWTLTGTQGAITCVFHGGFSGYGGWTIKDILDGPTL